ncbi:putative transcription factor interactor and regulator CCHC(Zn) family [Medicago truncatula]|uniref:Putative transcription factor interactor and regulator CCHC(Zn) family n=1 Tax=Medicago truncatula TaxID=3880 RepID=A0A396HVD2_MEDTR|nr:putative transcription factor interactor and regulator CCHC(Zn) family [Medicago truncatula]
MSGDEESVTPKYTSVKHDYDTADKKTDSGKAPRFNGDPEEFSWWKTNMYSFIMGLDEELWDILEDGVDDLDLDEEGAAIDRKIHTPAQKKLYKKHHKIRGIIVASIPRTEYMKMSDKSTAKAMFASLCANFEGSKKVKEAKALMLVHQYELFRMKDDESIEEMYSRFQTLVSGLQILKKSYVASDHVSKILRSLPSRWRPKVTAIEEAKDLNTLSVEDLVSSLKVHEMSLNEHETSKKSKSIALPSKGKTSKSSKAYKASESEEESPDGDSDEDQSVKMAMLSNKLEYLARKQKKFLSKRGSYKNFKKEDQKGCFNCKKPGHFIADCPDLQKEKFKGKSKKSSFNSSKFRKQIKKSLMATWEDLDSESGSDKEEADDDTKAAVGLVATVSSEAVSEAESDSEDENEVYSKIPRQELVDSLKELLSLFEHRTNELTDLKEKYVDLMKQQKSTLLELKASEEELKGFNLISTTYEDRLKSLCQKLQEKCDKGSGNKHEIALDDFIMAGIDRSKVASMIYSTYKNKGKGIGYSEEKSKEYSLKSYCDCIKDGLKSTFVPEGTNAITAVQSKPEASGSQAKITSKPENLKIKVMTKSDPKSQKIKILKRSEPVHQNLIKPESKIPKQKDQKNKAATASEKTIPKGVKPKVLNDQKPLSIHPKVQGRKSKTSKTNPKGPMKIWVPKSELAKNAGVLKGKRETKVMVPRQRMFKAHDWRESFVPYPYNERWRRSEVWWQPNWKDHWYRYYW